LTGRELFPPPPTCRTLFVLGTDEGEEELLGTEETMRCWSVCFAGGAAVEADGSVMAHRRRLQAAVLLFQAVESEIPLPFSSISFPLLSFFSLYPPSLFLSFLPVSSFSFLSVWVY